MTAIEVEYTATLAQRVGTTNESYEVQEDSATLESLINTIAARHETRLHGVLFDEKLNLLPSIVVAINDRQTGSEAGLNLQPGDHVLFLSPISGG